MGINNQKFLIKYFRGKFFKENTLAAQAFVKDNGKTVSDYLKSAGDVKVLEFKRVALG